MALADKSIAKLREVVQVLGGGTFRIALESGEAVTDVRGVADLAHLAVTHDIDAHVVLAANDLVYAVLEGVLELLGIDLVAAILREQEIDNTLWSWKAAYVRRQDAIGDGHRGVRLQPNA
jgi:hypothetical protein